MTEEPPRLTYPWKRKGRLSEDYHRGYRKGYAAGKKERSLANPTNKDVQRLHGELQDERRWREAADHRADYLASRLAAARQQHGFRLTAGLVHWLRWRLRGERGDEARAILAALTDEAPEPVQANAGDATATPRAGRPPVTQKGRLGTEHG